MAHPASAHFVPHSALFLRVLGLFFMSVAHRGLEWGQTGIGFLLKLWARRLTLFLQFPRAKESDGAWRGPDEGLCRLRHLGTLDIIRCPFAGASGFSRVADTDGWFGE